MDTPATEGQVAGLDLAKGPDKTVVVIVDTTNMKVVPEKPKHGPIRHAKVNKRAMRDASDGMRWHPHSISKQKALAAKHKTI